MERKEKIAKNDEQEGKIKEEKLYVILDDIFKKQYIINDFLASYIRLDYEVRNISYKIQDENLLEIFDENLLKRYLKKRYPDNYEVRKGNDGKMMAVLTHATSIISSFKKFESEFYFSAETEEEGTSTEDVINLFLKYSNMLDRDNTFETIKQIKYYQNPIIKKFFNPSKSEKDVKFYVQRYLKLYKEETNTESTHDTTNKPVEKKESKQIVEESHKEIIKEEKKENHIIKVEEKDKKLSLDENEILNLNINKDTDIVSLINDIKGYINIKRLQGKKFDINIRG